MIRDVGVLVHYLPPYSPDLNPIESVLLKVKLELQYELKRGNTTTIETMLLRAFTTITPTNYYKNWIYQTGIYH